MILRRLARRVGPPGRGPSRDAMVSGLTRGLKGEVTVWASYSTITTILVL